MIRNAALLTVAVASLISAPVQATNPNSGTVFDLIAARLALMKPVAAWKHTNAVAVEDLAREAVVLDKAASGAAETGIAPETIRPFFAAQIEAAKAIQTCWIARWEAGHATPPADPPDLRSDIRPRLISLGANLLAAVRQALDDGHRIDGAEAASFAAAVDTDCLDRESRGAIYTGLTQVRLAD